MERIDPAVVVVMLGVLAIFVLLQLPIWPKRRWQSQAPRSRGVGSGLFVGLCGFVIVVGTLWSGYRFVTAHDALAEISAGVWWLAITVFWGGAGVLVALGQARDQTAQNGDGVGAGDGGG